MSLTILGIGTAVPAAQVSRRDGQIVAAALCADTDEQRTFIPAIYAGSGISTRYFCLGAAAMNDVLNGTSYSGSPYLPTGLPGERGPTTRQRMAVYEVEAQRVALESSAAALDQSGIRPEELTHLVTVSCTGFAAPGFDIAIVNELGLSPAVERTHLGFMGCHAALNALRVANAYVQADASARVLICAVELCSVHYHYGWDPPKVVANALFADGAGAIVGAGQGPPGAWRVKANGSRLIPEAADVMTWTIGDHGFGMTLSKRIPDVIAGQLRPWLDQWLARYNLRLEQVQSWAIHPGGPKVLDAAAKAIGLAESDVWASREVLDQFGNMSSATVVFILKKLIEDGARLPCVSIGFGPGLNVEVALFA